MTNIPGNNPERRASGCKGYCDRGNQAKKICNVNCRKLKITGDRSDDNFKFSISEKEKIKYIILRYSKYITEKNINNYLFVAEINKEIELILNKPNKTQLDSFTDEIY